MLLFTYTNINILYTIQFFYHHNRSGMRQEWERNGSGLLYDNNMIKSK